MIVGQEVDPPHSIRLALHRTARPLLKVSAAEKTEAPILDGKSLLDQSPDGSPKCERVGVDAQYYVSLPAVALESCESTYPVPMIEAMKPEFVSAHS